MEKKKTRSVTWPRWTSRYLSITARRSFVIPYTVEQTTVAIALVVVSIFFVPNWKSIFTYFCTVNLSIFHARITHHRGKKTMEFPSYFAIILTSFISINQWRDMRSRGAALSIHPAQQIVNCFHSHLCWFILQQYTGCVCSKAFFWQG